MRGDLKQILPCHTQAVTPPPALRRPKLEPVAPPLFACVAAALLACIGVPLQVSTGQALGAAVVAACSVFFILSVIAMRQPPKTLDQNSKLNALLDSAFDDEGPLPLAANDLADPAFVDPTVPQAEPHIRLILPDEDGAGRADRADGVSP